MLIKIISGVCNAVFEALEEGQALGKALSLEPQGKRKKKKKQM